MGQRADGKSLFFMPVDPPPFRCGRPFGPGTVVLRSHLGKAFLFAPKGRRPLYGHSPVHRSYITVVLMPVDCTPGPCLSKHCIFIFFFRFLLTIFYFLGLNCASYRQQENTSSHSRHDCSKPEWMEGVRFPAMMRTLSSSAQRGFMLEQLIRYALRSGSSYIRNGANEAALRV